MSDDTARICVEIFRETTGMDLSPANGQLSHEEILARPIDSFDIDSLETMEFIMGVEDRFKILLNEEAVNRCSTLAELVDLVIAARRV